MKPSSWNSKTENATTLKKKKKTLTLCYMLQVRPELRVVLGFVSEEVGIFVSNHCGRVHTW